VIDPSHSRGRRVESGYKKKTAPAGATEAAAAPAKVKSSQKKESEPAPGAMTSAAPSYSFSDTVSVR